MSEFMFVLKGLIITIIITICLQVKVGRNTIETHFLSWIETSTIPVYLQGVATGAVVAVRNASKASSDFLQKTFAQKGINQTTNASRFNIQLKRSQPQNNDEEDAELE